jgi:uncharacterized protein (DUF1499 family)
MVLIKWLLIVVLTLALIAVIAGQMGLLSGNKPDDLGVRDGRLKRPGKTPNSVSSQAALWPEHPQLEYAHIAPLALRGDGPSTMLRIKAIVEAMPGTRVIESRGDYLYVQCTTRLMKYVDHVEFWFDAKAGVVQVRSASRVGRKDFNVNRERIEAVRKQLAG